MIFAHLSIVYLHVCPPPGLSSRSTQTRVDCLPSLNSIIIHNIIGKTVDENGLVFFLDHGPASDLGTITLRVSIVPLSIRAFNHF